MIRGTRRPGGRSTSSRRDGKKGGGGGGDKITLREILGCGVFLVGVLLTGSAATYCAFVAVYR
jgi:hypothetical protein